MAGTFNEFATGIGNTDAGFVLGTGKLLLKVPETMHFRIEGKLQPGVMAKDVILHCIGEIGFDGATYRAMRSEEHTSELQSRLHLVCRLLLEKKKKSERPPARTLRRAAGRATTGPRTRRATC